MGKGGIIIREHDEIYKFEGHVLENQDIYLIFTYKCNILYFLTYKLSV